MSVLTLDEIKERYNNPDDRITTSKKEHKKLLMHVHGIGVGEYITKLEGLENDIKIKIRKKLSRSNTDLFADILRPADKIFSAKGGSKTYELSDSQIEDFRNKLSKTKDGLSLAKWIQNIWFDKYVIDPNGIILVENEEAEERFAYPTYRSILSIRDYKFTGVKLDYIIFEPIKDDKGIEYVRVYDDVEDALYRVNGDDWEKIEDDTYTNKWGYVPAITCSDLVNPVTFYKKTPIYEQVELADEYLRENSVKTLFKYHHGFPFFWQYMAACPTCKGTGMYNNKTCPTCNGTKYAMKKDVSDVTYLKPPKDNDQPQIAPDIAGYVTPPIDSWQQMTTELTMLRDMMYYSHWGTIINRDDNEKTAFEVSVNTQPMQDRLNQYADSIEIVESCLTDILGKFYYADAYKGSQINYGRNYIILSPNQLMEEYLTDKQKGLGQTILNDKLSKYYESLYKNDSFKLIIFKKLIQVEPFIHNTLKEVKDLQVSSIEYNKKLYYNDWLSSLDADYIFTNEVGKLQKDLEEFTITKLKENETKSIQRVEGSSGLEGKEES